MYLLNVIIQYCHSFSYVYNIYKPTKKRATEYDIDEIEKNKVEESEIQKETEKGSMFNDSCLKSPLFKALKQKNQIDAKEKYR